MLKIFHKSLLKQLIISFQNSAKLSYYPDMKKKFNIILVLKRRIAISLKLPTNITLIRHYFEKIIFNKIYYSLLEKKLLTPNHSGFHSSESSINQLLVIIR